MPKMGQRIQFELELKDRYRKANAEVGITVEGKELPNLAVVGGALEEAVELIRNKIKQSYEVVPPRVDTPIAEPYARREVS
jgi:hypothetical protein